ncbi:hypothetical protein DVA67_025845 [Solirubrobacter sp. CPCC 204708]|uniref:Uncharacterized protein n=1 Tax=Solirubrobacter deserti TaxID=2282478 RepID=A0ABT4RFH1_9ACTN|nr:hypothetical protein [Solirubrobacter deserti]MBE2319424.1 hypothetical protein [Solirubrobacter deserti]MDA0137291.1 hypothetical protein [Solirubrobacter deserti]
MPEFTRYAPPAGSFIRTAQLGKTRQWIEPFMAQIEPYLANARQQSNYMPLGVNVTVALPDHQELLIGNSLVDLLEPLAIAFQLPHLRYVAATKVHGDACSLCIGPVGISNEGPHRWRTARGRLSHVSVKAQREFGYQIASQIQPSRWGPGHLDLAIRTGIMRDWIVTWRPLVDALVTVLGRRREGARREFDVEDGRVVSLALHHDVDTMLGNTVEVDVRWRLVGHAHGPELDYAVKHAEPLRA